MRGHSLQRKHHYASTASPQNQYNYYYRQDHPCITGSSLLVDFQVFFVRRPFSFECLPCAFHPRIFLAPLQQYPQAAWRQNLQLPFYFNSKIIKNAAEVDMLFHRTKRFHYVPFPIYVCLAVKRFYSLLTRCKHITTPSSTSTPSLR